MTGLLLLATAVAAGWVVVAARRQARRSRPVHTVEGFHRALDALSGERDRPGQRDQPRPG